MHDCGDEMPCQLSLIQLVSSFSVSWCLDLDGPHCFKSKVGHRDVREKRKIAELPALFQIN